MRILFTGASSFTGRWFVEALAKAGHQVTAIFRQPLEQYSGLRRQRIDSLLPLCQPIFSCDFGSETFLNIIQGTEQWDLLCHHAADVTNYKSPDFDVVAALENNCKKLRIVLEKLKEKNCHKVLLTGSVFEQNEGAGSDGLRAFSSYGLSKGFTAEWFKFHTAQHGMKLGKFVIPNPFGPYEEPRFTSYLMQNWIERKRAVVNTPAYVRDNIHVCLLAAAYLVFAQKLSSDAGFEKLNPSGYVESQGAFTLRFAREMRTRLDLPCEVELAHQTHFPEPYTRINTDAVQSFVPHWHESQAWDALASYYQQVFMKVSVC